MNAMAHVWGSSDNLVGLIFLLLPCGSWDWNLSDLVASTHPLGHLAGPNFFFKLGKPENDGDRWGSVLLKCLLLFLVSTFISNIVPIDDLRNQLSAFHQILR